MSGYCSRPSTAVDLAASIAAARRPALRHGDGDSLCHVIVGTLLSKGNVAPRTAQAATRHSSLDLATEAYTDPQLLGVAGALERLPELNVQLARAKMALQQTA